eukprot:TRINITY_DN5906_c1_g1_i1.p2 TRINITY_DN5906_c1_g1~~TRINITY_DN5906_c1_g1_i1.p2  ORF type:complete len:443 (+),score=138.66 TRINITY_DN5906_c1_g1_i1:124-1452(+)
MGSSRNAMEVGISFVKGYYEKFINDPEALKQQYTESSMVSHHRANEPPKIISGTRAIAQYLSDAQKVARKYNLITLECQPTVSDSVLILVRGICLMEAETLDFTHTVVLAKNEAGYHIANDIMESQPVPEQPDDWEGSQQRPAPQKQEKAAPARSASPTAAEQRKASPRAAAAPAPAPAASAAERREPPAAARTASPRPAAAGAARKPSPVKERPEGGALTWAALARATPAAEGRPAAGATVPQRVTGGKVPGLVGAQPRDEGDAAHGDRRGRADADWTTARGRRPSPPRGGRDPSPPRDSQRRGQSPLRGKSPERGQAGAQSGGQYRWPAIYVSKVPESLREDDIDKVFGQFGKIMGKTIRQGFFFVDFEQSSAMDECLRKADGEGIYFAGQRLNVQERKSPEERQRDRSAALAAERAGQDRGPRGRGGVQPRPGMGRMQI